MGSICSSGEAYNSKSGISIFYIFGKKVKVCNELISRILIND